MIRYSYDWGSVSIRLSKFIASIVFITSAAVGRAELSTDEQTEDPVHRCGMILLREAGKTGPDTIKLPGLYSRASMGKDDQFLIHMLAVIFVESRFDKKAKSHADAHGLMQMTEIAVKDAVKHCNLRPIDMDNLFDSYTNVRYGTCYLNKLLEDTEGDWERALIAYNGGYMQLQRYDRGESVASETANYVLKVKRAIKLCN